MERQLSFFCSPSKSFPSFVIPVFSVPGENSFCVQELGLNGRIVEFKRFNPDHFHSVAALAPALNRTVGDAGISAFWLEEGTVFVGTLDELRMQLDQLNEVELPPFVAVEVMTLVGDAVRLSKVADTAAQLLSGRSAIDYRGRAIERSRLVKSLATRADIAPTPEREKSIDAVIAELQNPMKSEDWFHLWYTSWKKFENDTRLFHIAKWRAVEFQNDLFVPYIITSIIVGEYSQEAKAVATKWLLNADLSASSWGHVWQAVQGSNRERNVTLEDMAVLHLDKQADNSRYSEISYTWCSIWLKLWKLNDYRSSLESSARTVSERSKRFSEPYIRTVLNLLIDNASSQSWSESSIRFWLRTPKSNTIWVETYLNHSRKFNDKKIQMAGIHWLYRLGAGMNSWHDLWKHCSKIIKTSESVEISTLWLFRARKDLSSWPDVFDETLNLLGGSPTPLLIRAAKNWVSFHRGQKRNPLIERVAKAEAQSPSP
jgi:hypothetical protein